YAFLLDSGNRRSRNSSNDFSFSSRQYWPARTSQRYLPSSTNLVSRSFSCRASQARIASILLSTSWARRRFSLGGMGGYLVTKFVKQTKIDSRLADQPSLHQVVLVETEPEKRTGGTRILGKADAAVGREKSGLNPTGRVVDQGPELLPLLVGDGGPQVLDFNRALTDKDDLGNFIDSSHPGITNQLRIQCRNAVRLLGIAGGAGLPLQRTGCAIQFADRVDEGDKLVARTQRAGESDLLMAVRLVNLDAPVLGEALEQLNALLEHVVPGVVSRVGQFQVLARCPLLEQDGRWVFVAEQSRHRLLEAAAEEHGSAGVFFLPAIEVAMAGTASAGRG